MRAQTHLTLDVDVPAQLFHGAVHGGEAQAGSLTSWFRRKKRFEDFAQHLGAHAGAGIGDAQRRMGSGDGTRMRRDVRLVEVRISG